MGEAIMGKIIYVNFKGPYRGKIIDTVGIDSLNQNRYIPSLLDEVELSATIAALDSLKDEDEKDPA
jgi:hypothetical protein